MTHNMVFDETSRIERISWDKEAEIDLFMNRGFIINQKAFEKRGNEQVKLDRGTHSPRFGSDWEDQNSFAERYRCKCGETVGGVFEGEECPECKTEVTFKDVSLDTFGWIRINKHVSIIAPLYFKSLRSAIGKNDFNDIIQTGDIERSGLKKEGSKSNPYSGIGLIKLKEQFDEIMAYYRKKRKNKAELIDMLIQEKDKIFASHIPVYSSVLRPVSFSSETIFMTKIDKKYNVIVSKVGVVNKLLSGKKVKRLNKIAGRQIELEIPTILYELQLTVNSLWDLTFSMIDQKHGHIRENLLGGRLNYSARNVIRPDFTLRADEVRINYHTFAELYKLEIIAHISQTQQMSIKDAYNKWFIGIKDGSLLTIMNHVLKKYKPLIFINRNPTINYGSFLVMKIKSIIEDTTDYTMAIPNQILTISNADYDGDIFNIGCFKSREVAKAYERIFNPRKNMFIDRNNGLFNNDVNLHKDQMIGLWEFNNI